MSNGYPILELVPHLSFMESMASTSTPSNTKRPLSSSSGSPQPKIPRLDNPCLSQTDADREKFNEEVVKRVNQVQQLYRIPEIHPALILNTVVITANGLLNNKYAYPQSASDLLVQDHELSIAVDAAWKNKSFSSLREMC